jgi:hypothetical protein
MIPTAYVVHQSRGRLRLKLPNKCRNDEWLSRTATRLEQVPDVEGVEVAAVSGSLLIRHHAGIALKGHLAETGLFRIIDGPLSSPPVLDRVTDGVFRSDRALERRTGGRVNLKTLLILILLILAIVQSLRQRIMVPAITLLMFAAQLAFMPKDSKQKPPS